MKDISHFSLAAEQLSKYYPGPIEYSEECGWIIVRSLPLGRSWNKSVTNLLILYDEELRDVSIFLDGDLKFADSAAACDHIFEYDLKMTGWKKLCTWSYRDDEPAPEPLSAFTRATSVLYLPSICSLRCKRSTIKSKCSI